MVNLMVNHTALDRTFAALADPTRRALLARLGTEDALSVSELARPFTISLPAVMKHLDVLAGAGLVRREKSGRTVTCRINAGPMEEAMGWLRFYERFWTEKLDRLAALLETAPWPQDPPSPSTAASGPRRIKSTKPGPTQA